MADIPDPFGVGWDRLQGWRNQYARMQRWHRRTLLAIATEVNEGDYAQWPEEMWDTAMAFFQSAHHLKDWILREHPDVRQALHNAISRNEHLVLCADICNGTKHGRVDRNHRVTVHVKGLREFAPDVPSKARWLVLTPEGPINLEVLANNVLSAWNSLLRELPGLHADFRPDWPKL